jgi:hypothetical protein
LLLHILELFLIQLSKCFHLFASDYCVCFYRKILESYPSQVHDLVLFLGSDSVVGEDVSSVYSSVSQTGLTKKDAQSALRLINGFIIKSVTQFFLEQLKQTASLFRRGGAVANSQEKIAKQFKLDVEAYGKEVNDLLGPMNDEEKDSLDVHSSYEQLLHEVTNWSSVK